MNTTTESDTAKIDLYDIYAKKARYIRHNFAAAVKLQCSFDNPIFKQVIRDEINIDTPKELLPALNKLAHQLKAEYESTQRTNNIPIR
jgi:hypothetical protein